jgi:hypothetical protein
MRVGKTVRGERYGKTRKPVTQGARKLHALKTLCALPHEGRVGWIIVGVVQNLLSSVRWDVVWIPTNSTQECLGEVSISLSPGKEGGYLDDTKSDKSTDVDPHSLNVILIHPLVDGLAYLETRV